MCEKAPWVREAAILLSLAVKTPGNTRQCGDKLFFIPGQMGYV